jgi:signal transduction histidine kinase
MLKQGNAEEKAEIVTKVTDVMDSCLDSVQRLIDDVLDMTKLAKGVIELDVGVWDVKEILVSVVRLFEPKAQAKGLIVRYESKRDIGCVYAKVDRVRLMQVATNLVSNAIKFSDEGDIVVSMESESITKGKRMLIISVEDRGVGLSKDDPSRIFNLFEQGWAGAARGGTGIGLAICQQLVKLMGGKISARSFVVFRGLCLCRLDGFVDVFLTWRLSKTASNDDGRGSLFQCSIPVNLRNSNAVEIPPLQSGELYFTDSPRVLLAEDNEASLQIMSMMVRANPSRVFYTVSFADSTNVISGIPAREARGDCCHSERRSGSSSTPRTA